MLGAHQPPATREGRVMMMVGVDPIVHGTRKVEGVTGGVNPLDGECGMNDRLGPRLVMHSSHRG